MANFTKALTIAIPGEEHLADILMEVGVDELAEYELVVCNDYDYIYVNWDTINVAETIRNVGVYDDDERRIIKTITVTRIHLNCGSCFYIEGDFISGKL